MPKIVVHVSFQQYPVLNLRIKNVGNGPAHDITFTIDKTFTTMQGASINAIPFIKNGIGYLSPGDYLEQQSFLNAHNPGQNNQVLEFEYSYYDDEGNKYFKNYKNDMKSLDIFPVIRDANP